MTSFLQLADRGRLVISLVVLFLLATPTTIVADDDGVRNKIESAISEYQQGLLESDPDARLASFRKAEIAFASVLEDQNSEVSFSPDIYINWGNAAFQVGKTGVAVFAYRKAIGINKFDTRAQKNLEFIRSQMPEWARADDDNSISIRYFLFWNQWYSKSVLRISLAILFLTGCLLLAAASYSKVGWLKSLCILPFAIWTIVMLSQYFDSAEPDQDHVVFVQDESLAYTADSRNSPTSFASTIPAGTEAIATESRDNWTHVRFGADRQGWVQNSAIRWINN